MNHETDTFLTLGAVGEGSFKAKGSRFLAFAHPIENENDVSQLLAHYRKKYFDARHHCFAWILGPERTRFRANDDGEPSGTAGKPILNQILSAGLTNVLIVVVRYFGGIKLGTSGLINAYKTAAKEALDKAPRLQVTIDEKITARFAYPLLNDVMRFCKEYEVVPKLRYDPQHIELECFVRKNCAKTFSEKLSHIFGVELT